MTSLGEDGEITATHDSGVVQLNLAQDEVGGVVSVFLYLVTSPVAIYFSAVMRYL